MYVSRLLINLPSIDFRFLVLFQAPQTPKTWDGVRAAMEHGQQCFQRDFMTGRRMVTSGSEDCLYLNIYTPKLNPNKPLPVMFWIHGGAFISGCGNDENYGADFLVTQNVILVTINYRLEILGFLCLDTEEIPGNAGIKDQVAALRWVKENIACFGGDPDNITIFGNSAGAASVSFHLTSPMTKGLFKRAIAQSGFSTCALCNPHEARERAIAFAKKLGFTSEDDKEIAKFFKSQPVDYLVQVKVPITLAEIARDCDGLNMFGIVSEKKFGDNERYSIDDPYDALRNEIHNGVEVLTGYCADEGLLNLALVDIPKYLSQINSFREYLVPMRIAVDCPLRDKMEVGRMMKEYYCNGKPVGKDNMEQVVKFSSMNMFVYDLMQGLKICAKNNTKAFLYKLTCKSERNFRGSFTSLGKILGRDAVCHADCLGYIFHMSMKTVDKNSESFKMIDNIVKLWTNFAKYG